ncbi:MAG: non-canonical purine NTP pyrophosphatase [Candidatus Paceibacterota bacterium]|jgi:XTP/dITP diphosphohydrolase
MKKEVLLGTYNQGKVERFKNLIASTGLDFEIHIPSDVGLENFDVEESGSTLAENAEIKVRAYFGKTDMPILANDTGFWVEGEGLVEAPKRTALEGIYKENLSQEEIAEALLKFWQGVAKKHGGRVNAAWVEAFALLNPDGTLRTSESRREIILTDHIFGKSHIQMPVRALYISKITNKPSLQHTPEEELLELKPVTDALIKILS